MIIKKCPQCNKDFRARHSTNVYCSKACTGESQRKGSTKICIVCGKEYYRKISESIKTRFCSYKCKSQWQGENMKGENAPFYGKHFTPEMSRRLSNSLKGKFVGELNPFYGKTHTNKTKEAISKANAGSGNVLWKDGLSKKRHRQRDKQMRTFECKQFVKRVKEKYNNTCLKCGEGKKIQVHHLKSYQSNVSCRFLPVNGVCLCRACHYAFHGKYGRENNTISQFKEFINNQSISI